MMKEVIATGRTVDAAIDSGCAELGLERGDVDFEIISMPKKGFLGLSQIPAKVRVFVQVPDPKPALEQKPAPQEEKPLPTKKSLRLSPPRTKRSRFGKRSRRRRKSSRRPTLSSRSGKPPPSPPPPVISATRLPSPRNTSPRFCGR